MKSNIFVILSFVFCTSLLTLSSAFANTEATLNPFSYRVQVPSLQVTCDAHAQQLAREFVSGARDLAGAQIQNVSGACEETHTISDNSITYSIDTIVISYLANYEVQPYRAHFTGHASLETPEAGIGLFNHYSDCFAQISQQQTTFEAETGLTAIASHCDLDTEGSQTFSLTVEGFGTQKAVLYEYDDSGTAFEATSAVETLAAQSAITASGGQLAYVDNSHVFFYSKDPIYITTMILGFYGSASDCKAQVSDAQGVLNGSKFENGTVICAGAVADQALEIVASGGTQQQAQQDTTDRYATFADCLADKPRVIQNATSSGANVAGAICRRDESASTDYVLDFYFVEK